MFPPRTSAPRSPGPGPYPAAPHSGPAPGARRGPGPGARFAWTNGTLFAVNLLFGCYAPGPLSTTVAGPATVGSLMLLAQIPVLVLSAGVYERRVSGRGPGTGSAPPPGGGAAHGTSGHRAASHRAASTRTGGRR